MTRHPHRRSPGQEHPIKNKANRHAKAPSHDTLGTLQAGGFENPAELKSPDNPFLDFPEDHRTNIRMSKLARMLQTSASQSNWNEMAKMIFRADPDQGRHDYIRRFFLLNEERTSPEIAGSSYNTDQFRSVLLLMIIISIAEKRTQDLYKSEFAKRCDEISRQYGLQDDQYWTEGNAPAEWDELNRQFERKSATILIETLNDYGQGTIAQLVQENGVEQFFSIMKSLRSQFMRVLGSIDPETENSSEIKQGSVPETLQS